MEVEPTLDANFILQDRACWATTFRRCARCNVEPTTIGVWGKYTTTGCCRNSDRVIHSLRF